MRCGRWIGVVSSPVVAVDGVPTGPIPPVGHTRTIREVQARFDEADYRPVYVELHGMPPARWTS